VERTPGADVPSHLRSAATSGERDLGIGVGYRYPHDDPAGVIAQQYLPDGVDRSLYHPGDAGDESALAARLRLIDEILGKKR
jgi:putative ATPase